LKRNQNTEGLQKFRIRPFVVREERCGSSDILHSCFALLLGRSPHTALFVTKLLGRN